jgi:hypothetical protein
VRLAWFAPCLVAPAWALGCDPNIIIGSDAPPLPDASLAHTEAGTASEAAADANAGDSGASAETGGLQPLTVPWSTGFENGFSDWQQPPSQGFCYALGGASFAIVGSPVHSGAHAAAFTVDTMTDASSSQTRCVRQGVLPLAAYYGAWYYVPSAAVNTGNWNLLHFQGANVPDGTFAHGLWDVSFSTPPGAPIHAYGFDFLRVAVLDASAVSPVPIGSWFHLEVYLRRATDGTGQFAVYQDGRTIADASGVATDDSAWGQWFVGNLATALSPPVNTLYVDDVTVSETP